MFHFSIVCFMCEKKGRGGYRVGSGRKRKAPEDRRAVVHVGLAPDVAAWLEQEHGRRKGVYVESLIRADWKKKGVI